MAKIKGDELGNFLIGTNDDRLAGGADNDHLHGGYGQDDLCGGSGADVFEYYHEDESRNTEAQRDVIWDFSQAEGDRLQMSSPAVFIGK